MQMNNFNQVSAQKVVSGTNFPEQKSMQKNKISLQPVTNLSQDYNNRAKVYSTEAHKREIN